MTLEEKRLLLIDLSARLSYYKIICKIGEYSDYVLSGIDLSNKSQPLIIELHGERFSASLEHVRPYLRPISSMTESEIDKLFDILHIDKDGKDEDWIKINDVVGIKFFFPTGKWIENVAEAYDFLNSIYIDYRGLIEKGLALEAKPEMYKI